MSFALHVKNTLLSEICLMDKEHDKFSRHPGVDFSRTRKLHFRALLHFQLSMSCGSINQELVKYFDYQTDTPTLSAE